MSNKQRHRGQHPNDEDLFDESMWTDLRAAIVDLFYLRSKNYGISSSLKIVGDRYRLRARQRYALQRIVSSEEAIRKIRQNQVGAEELINVPCSIDAFNVLILAEVLHSDGLIFECLDGTFRDIASIHGSYHPIDKTETAIIAIGKLLEDLQTSKVKWYLDAPVSNSGRLKKLILDTAVHQNWKWEVTLVTNPDPILIELKDEIVLSSDRDILSKCDQWFNFSHYLVESRKSNNHHIITLEDLGLQAEDFTF